MKTITLALALCQLTIADISAADARPARSKVESLIASMPTKREVTEQSGKQPGPELAAKLKNAGANCKQIESLITIGDSIFDYPGLLALGTVKRNANRQTLTLTVKVRLTGEYGGFRCTYTDSGTIIEITPMVFTF